MVNAFHISVWSLELEGNITWVFICAWEMSSMFLHISRLWSLNGSKIDPFRWTRPAPNHTSKKCTCQSEFKGVWMWKTPSVSSAVPLDPTALMCHRAPPSYTLMSLSPMEVIRHALFMLAHSTSSHVLYVPPLQVTGKHWDTQNSLWGSPVRQEPRRWWCQGKTERRLMDGAAVKVCLTCISVYIKTEVIQQRYFFSWKPSQ